MTPRRFPIRFTGSNNSLRLVGLGPDASWVELGADAVTVRMGWAFNATIDRSAVRAVRPVTDRVLSRGVHGWRGRWLVNGSAEGLVEIELDPPARARAVGVPVRVELLRVSVVDPDGFLAELT